MRTKIITSKTVISRANDNTYNTKNTTHLRLNTNDILHTTHYILHTTHYTIHNTKYTIHNTQYTYIIVYGIQYNTRQLFKNSVKYNEMYRIY